jgi:hypothetical protein
MFKSGLAVLLAIAALILALVFGALPWNSIDYRPDMFEEAGKAAAALFVVAVFLERAMAVVNDLLFGVEVVEAKNQIRFADVTNSVADAATAEARLEAIDENRQRVRLGGSFLAAVLLAAAGARTLGELLVLEANGGLVISGSQLQLFRTMDILLTAGLLAGGSNGLAAIIDLIRKRVDASKAQQAANLSELRRTGFTEARSIPGWPVAFGGPRLDISKAPERGERTRLRQDFSGAGSESPDDDAAFQEWLGADQAASASLDVALTAKTPRIALSLDMLRSQLNAAYPNRNRASDGWIGDEAHCGPGGGKSDHCPNIKDGNKWVVTAFDATHDPGDGCDMEAVTAAIVGAKDARIKYIIWNRRICASYAVGNNAAWTWRPYAGKNPHDKHAHFSVSADKASYDDQAPWTIA